MIQRFIDRFKTLTATRDHEGFTPYPWQVSLFQRMVEGRLPEALDIPTGLGKTSVMPIWLLARLENPHLPRRLIYIVDRRTVVDQASDEAARLAQKLSEDRALSTALGLKEGLPVSTLRGQLADNRLWSENPAHPAIVVGTVDMTGSRLAFQGYRLSRKQWPVHAGLLAYDSLILLDEAHLNPAFEGMLGDIRQLATAHPALPPVSQIMSLSATATGRQSDGLNLTEADLAHPRVRALLDAPKPLTLRPAEGNLPEQLAAEAWRLACPENGPSRRILVFCNERKMAGKVYDLLSKALRDYGKADKKDYIQSHLNLLVGERRVHERQSLRDSALYKWFLGETPPPSEGQSVFDTAVPAFIIATSAGEVGIDLDAQGMVCDLVSWERMVQRLGRVNRKGSPRAAPVTVITARDNDTQACLSLLRNLPLGEADTHDASVGALRRLNPIDIRQASTPVPLRPELTLPVAQGWTLTSLQEDHTGSPDLTPFLRGWVEADAPQCEVFWRAYIPWRQAEDRPDSAIIADWLEAAPPHLSEILEAPVWRVIEVLKKQFRAEITPESLQKGCVLLLDKRGRLLGHWTYRIFEALLKDSRQRERFENELAGRRLLLQADIGGLGAHGLLEETASPALTLDTDPDWAEATGLRFTLTPDAREARTASGFQFTLSGRDDEAGLVLSVHHLSNDMVANENTALSRHAQTLAEHQAWASRVADDMAKHLNLPDDLRHMLRLAIAHHDAGKAHPAWQSSMNAPKDGRIYAKTTGVGAKRTTNGYRHELGSLLDPQAQAALSSLPQELEALGWHLILAHHGHARPHINPFIPRAAGTAYHLPPELSRNLALEGALRFAQVQKHWGPWGLAWWEAVFRAADARASMWNDRRDTLSEDQRAMLETKQ